MVAEKLQWVGWNGGVGTEGSGFELDRGRRDTVRML